MSQAVINPISPSSAPSAASALPLRDIHLPADIGYWPLATGWWLLLAAVIVLGLGVLLLIRFFRRHRLRRLALRQLESLQVLSDRELVIALSRLLRQAALSHFPRHEVAGLSGKDWLVFLDRPFTDQPFTLGAGRILADAPYRPQVETEGVQLLALCRQWLQKLPPQKRSCGRGR